MEPDGVRAVLEERVAWLEGLRQAVGALTALADREGLLGRILGEALAATGARKGFVLGPDGEGELAVIAARRADGKAISSPMGEISRSIAGTAFREGRAMLFQNAQCDPRTMDLESVDTLSLEAVVCQPLRHQGQVLGVIYLENEAAAPFGMDKVVRVQAFADCAALALAGLSGAEPARLGRPGPGGRQPFGGILGNSPRLVAALSVARRVAAADVPVLLVGETGTGKELFARGIHDAGWRASGEFVAVNCGAIPASLVESELFGHEAGAFTGAAGRRLGVFEQAEGGTLFLDEVQALPLAVQATLLRVLESGEVRRVGGEGAIRVDARVLAASNQELEGQVESGDFRQDLYYRLKGIRIDVPPLRDRRDDIPLLVEHLLAHFSKKHKKPVVRLRPWAWQALMRHHYPGNVRELRHAVEHGVLLCQDERIWVEDLPAELQTSRAEAPAGAPLVAPATHEELRRAKQELKAQLERAFVLHALERTGGNISEAARLTGMNRVQLQNLVTALGIEPRELRPSSG